MNDHKLTARLLHEIADDVEAKVDLVKEWEVDFLNNGKWEPLGYTADILGWVVTSPNRVRRKPRTITVNGVEVPEPLREIVDGQEYWLADVKEGCSPCRFYLEVPHERRWLRNGLCHATAEAAKAHREAMLLPSREANDE